MERTRRSPWIIPAFAALPLAFATGARAEAEATADATLKTAAERDDDESTDPSVEEGEQAKVAQATPAAQQSEGEGEGATQTEGAVTEQAAPSAPEKKDDRSDKEKAAANLNPALQPGGVVATASSFPLRITMSATQSVGSGTFSPGYSAVPSFATNMTFRPSYVLPQLFDWQPRMILNGAMALDIEWASSSVGTVAASATDRQLRVGDPAIGLIFPGLINLSFMNTSITPIVRAIAPLSVSSRFNNRLVGFGGGAQAMYSQGLGAFGNIALIYSPSASGWTFTDDAPTVRCGESLNAGGGLFGSANPTDASTDYPLAIARPEEFTDDAGNCKVRGRQIIGSMVNSFAASYSIGDPTGGNHNVAISAGSWHSFFRPLADRPELRGEYAAPQSYVNFAEWSFGDISYSYSLPIETSVTITGGITSLQPMWTNSADPLTGQVLPRLPWFDLVILSGRGSNNFTSGYLNLTVAL